MDILGQLIDLNGGFFSRAQARDLGYDDRAVGAAVRHGAWHRIRRGYFTLAGRWTGFDKVERHRVLSRAVMHSLGDNVALSHVSAVIHHGIDVWDMDLRRVHVTRLDGGPGRIERDVVHHVGKCVDGEVVVVDGVRVLTAVRSTLEAGSRAGTERALVILNSALAKGLFDVDQLDQQFLQMQRWPYLRALHVPVRLADGASQSVGETRGKFFFWSHHLPAPILQYEVRYSTGSLLGTCDWGWPDRGLLGEFDGRVKYGRLVPDGQAPGDVVFAEKQREDLLREATGCRMIRLVWSDYDQPARLDLRLRRSLGLLAG